MATPKVYTLAAAAVGITGAVFMPSSSYGLGGAALNAAIPVTPREAVTASPAISISGASVAASAAASSAGASGTSSSSTQQMGGGGNAAATVAGTESSSAPAAVSRQGRRSSGGAAPATGGAAASAKAPVWDKNVPPVPVVEENPLTITFTAGWESTYMFKGLDNIRNSSLNADGSLEDDMGVWYAKLGMQYKGLGLSVGYLQGDGKTLPGRQNFRVAGNKLVGHDAYYGETILGANYTVAVVPDALELTVGYNAYFFNDSDFWRTGYQGELWGRLAYTQIPFVTPSVVYSYFHGGGVIDGQYLEFRLDSNVPLYNSDSFSVGLNPYASVGYDMEYNAGNNDWSGLELGLRIPFAVGEHLIISLDGHYGWDINDAHANYDEVGFWGGVAVTYKF